MRTLPLALLWSSILCSTVAALAQTAPVVPANAPYKDGSVGVEQRVADLLGRMTLEEKASMLAGSGWMESTPIERLGIPAIKMCDGPMGVRGWAAPPAPAPPTRP